MTEPSAPGPEPYPGPPAWSADPYGPPTYPGQTPTYGYPSAPGYPPPGYPPQPGYPQPGYPQPGYPPPYGYPPAPRATNGLAIASLVLGVLWLYWLGSLLALIFGLVARSQIKQRGESGDGMAIAGVVLGLVGLGALLLFFVIGVTVADSGG